MMTTTPSLILAEIPSKGKCFDNLMSFIPWASTRLIDWMIEAVEVLQSIIKYQKTCDTSVLVTKRIVKSESSSKIAMQLYD